MNHSANCKFPDEETFECNRCGAVCLYCCGCGGQDGESDNAPPLCLKCGAEYYREREQAEQEARDAELDKFRAKEKAVTDAVDQLQAALKSRSVSCSEVNDSTLSSSRYFYAGGFKVRVSDHTINPYGSGFWKEDGTELHSAASFELIIPAEPAEIESLADEILAAVTKEKAEEEE